jgi:hypothetical protein
VQRSLPEMNQAKKDKQINFQVYAFHRGGEKPQAVKIINGKDAKGKDWALDFVWSSPAFEKQLGGVRGLPSYYVVDSHARVRGVVKGHSEGTMATVKWLVEEIGKRDVQSGSAPGR